MQIERLTQALASEKIKNPKERALADLMASHYGKIQEVLDNPGERLDQGRWAMDWCETVDGKGEKVYVIAGLLPAQDINGDEIPGMRATPAVFCIPERNLTIDDNLYFDKTRLESADQNKREEVIQTIIKDRHIHKLYNMHGWGADPYVSALPMIEATGELDGVAVLLGMMGSMGTTFQDKSPSNFAKRSKYSWNEIRAQALGAMYYLEDAEAFNPKNYDENEIVRIIFGHSMQGKTTLRLMIDDLAKLPNTFFVSMTPVLAGGNNKALKLARETTYLRNTKRHVRLGHNFAGWVMQAELKTIARLFDAETRRSILCSPAALYYVKKIMNSYLAGGDSYGQDLIVYAHLLEYISNPWSIMRATENLDDSGPAVHQNSISQVSRLVDRFMLVRAGQDKVLSPDELSALEMELKAQIESHKDGELVLKDRNDVTVDVLNYKDDNHYLRKESWTNGKNGVIAMVKERVGWSN